MSEKLTSRKNPKVLEAFAYKKNIGDYFLVEGFHTVVMALEARLAVSVFALREIDTKGTPLYLVTDEIIDKLSSTRNPEGIVALCKKREAGRLSSNRVLMLDQVQDPGNIGTLLRTALAFGYNDVILTKGSCDPYNAKSLLASQGAIFMLNIFQDQEEAIINKLKEDGYFVVGTSLQRAVSLTDFALPEGKLCLLLGNEGKGVSQTLLNETNINVKIPIANIDSLNVGVAGGILMQRFSLIK